MLKTRMISGKTVFYETTSGVNITSIKSVSFDSLEDVVVTVVYKDGVPFVYLPMRDNTPLVKLEDAVNKMGLIITKVA